jgi:hypothetical protein
MGEIEIIEKIKLRNNYLIKKRNAQKSRRPDSYIIEIEDVIGKINNELMELKDPHFL